MARRRIFPIFIPHLGCPNECVFCDQRRISGSPSPASGADVTARLARAEADGLREIELAFYGGSFTAVDPDLQEELLAAAQPFLRSGVLSAIRVSTRPDAVDPAAIARLRQYGVSTVELGAQSMDDAVLDASGRGHTAADTERAARLLKAEGFSLVLQMMTGLPGADRESDIATARRLIALAPDAVRIYPTVIVKGTALYEMWREGRYREHTVEDAVAVCAELLPLFEAAGIPVIRLGLNPTEELSAGQAAGGAYHPALGELVRGEILRRQAEAVLKALPAQASAVTLGVAQRDLSAMIGPHRKNIDALMAAFHLRELRVRSVPDADNAVTAVDWTE